MCIKEEFRNWHRKEMDFANFEKIVPSLKDVESVVLEGWGESLLYPRLTDCIRLVKEQGAAVGFVTSGMGLTAEYAERLVNAGVDFIGFSLSGATSKTHNAIRINSDFDVLVDSIRLLKKIMVAKGTEAPRIHIVYLMLQANIMEVPLLVDLAHDIGVSEIVLINITHVATAWQDGQKIFTCEGDVPPPHVVDEAREKARNYGIVLSVPSFSPCDVAVCSENPLGNLYISVDGEVSPCVYLCPPIPSPFKRIFCGEEKITEKVSFGNIFQEPIETLWNKKEYVAFRQYFKERERRSAALYESLISLECADAAPYPAPPTHCTTCHKMIGV